MSSKMAFSFRTLLTLFFLKILGVSLTYLFFSISLIA